MSTVLAIELSGNEAVLVKARAILGEKIEILEKKHLSLSESETVAPLDSDLTTTPVSDQSTYGSAIDDSSVADVEHDLAVGLINSEQVLYTVLDLPFSDPKKIEQVAPLQLQDNIPFEIEDFVLDPVVVGQSGENGQRIIASLANRETVANALSCLSKKGLDPRYLTTKASALAALATHHGIQQNGLVAYLQFGSNESALALLLNGKPYLLRSFFYPPDARNILLQDVICSLAKSEQESEQAIKEIFVIASPEEQALAAARLGPRVRNLKLEDLTINNSGQELSVEQTAWSAGVAAVELLEQKAENYPLVNFRQGNFAYRRVWQELWAAVQKELFYVMLFVVLAIFWYGFKLYSTHQALSEVDDKVQQLTSSAFAGESVPYRTELSFIDSRLQDLEDQLRSIGSLSNLSPLESLKELVTAISTNLDVQVESVNIASSKISIRGSVGKPVVIAELSSALNARKDRFCKANVEPQGNTSGGRVGFTAQINLCE